MRESILPPLYAVLAFLMPLGMYCLFLSSINRRARPVIVSGAIDALGLMFAGSGFFLVTVPILINEFYRRTMSSEMERPPEAVWVQFWMLWLIYFLFLVSGCASMLLWRARKTMIYNVEPEVLLFTLEQSATQLGLGVMKQGQRIVLAPAESTDAVAKPSGNAQLRHAELTADSFPSLCHVTLHWHHVVGDVRRELEASLSKNAEPAVAHYNPASGWFLSISGMIFGAVAMIVLTLVFLLVMSVRW